MKNDALGDLEELAELIDIKGDLYIGDNAWLPTLTDLAALKTVGGRLEIVVNPALPQADAVAWAAPIVVGKDRKIAGNKDPDPLADPCPWFQDGECDEPMGGLGICAEDSDGDDCCPGWCE